MQNNQEQVTLWILYVLTSETLEGIFLNQKNKNTYLLQKQSWLKTLEKTAFILISRES